MVAAQRNGRGLMTGDLFGVCCAVFFGLLCAAMNVACFENVPPVLFQAPLFGALPSFARSQALCDVRFVFVFEATFLCFMVD